MINDTIINDINVHVQANPEREICGVIGTSHRKLKYIPCRNIAAQNNHFVIDPQDYADAEDNYEILCIVHSHININPQPSQADLVGIEKSGLPWLIMNHPVGNWTVSYPNNYEAPYVGREFSHGILDCYSIWRDYYKRELGIEMVDYDRGVEWWLKGDDLYEKNYTDAGFVVVDDLQVHDIILMKVGSPVANHAAVYLGDDIILHHVMGKISSRDIYGGWWKKITVKILRHKSFL